MSTLSHSFLFYFTNEYMSLVETKSSAGELHWRVIDLKTQKLENLKFKSMGEEVINGNQIQVRQFDNAELRFDHMFAKFILNNQAHLLERQDTSKVTEQIKDIISRS